MTDNPQEYIITEELLGRVKSVIIEDANHEYATGFFKQIRSRPYTSATLRTRWPITFDSIANEVRLTDTGYVKCVFDGLCECDTCGEMSDELYTHLDYETDESDGWICPICAFKVLRDAHFEAEQYDLILREEHDAAIASQVREEERERVLNAIFPKPTQSDLKNGWEYNYRFIEKISDRTKELSEDDACMEVVMVVLKTLEESLRTDKVEP